MSELIVFDKANRQKAFLIGTDEAGRGPAAGSVYAAAVCFVKEPTGLLEALNDSKKLTAKKREELFDIIVDNSVYAICESTVAQIDKMNILNASLDAMRRACEEVVTKLGSNDVEVFVDGNKLIKNLPYPQRYLIKGDSKSASVAAASILAKVARDRVMKELDKSYPQYKWESNKGYLSKVHIDAIKKYGITEHHRKLFVRNILKENETEQLKLV